MSKLSVIFDLLRDSLHFASDVKRNLICLELPLANYKSEYEALIKMISIVMTD